MGTPENTPLVSVIIPTYNRPEQLRRAISSVLAQTYQNFEIIIVDDASSVDVAMITGEFNDKRITYIRHEKNKGASAARNSGLRAAQGQFINFLDDDDEILPSKFAKQIAIFQNSSSATGVVYCGFCYALEETEETVYQRIPSISGNVFLELLKSNFLVMQAPLIKKVAIEQVGFLDETLPGCQDWDLWLRLSQHFEFSVVPEVLAKVWVHGEQITADLQRKILSREMIREKYADDLKQHPEILSFNLARLSKLYFLADERQKARRYMWQAYKLAPLNYKYLGHLLFSLLSPGNYKKYVENTQFTIGNITFY